MPYRTYLVTLTDCRVCRVAQLALYGVDRCGVLVMLNRKHMNGTALGSILDVNINILNNAAG